MPTRRLPNSTATVIRTLITARDAWKQFPNDRLINTVEFQRDDVGRRRRIARLWCVIYLNDDGRAAEESSNDLTKPVPAP